MFDSPTDPITYELESGIAVCLYYGLIAYAGFVFLSVVTVGVSYDAYSLIQTARMRSRKKCTYYIFTSITNDSLVLAEDIKRREQSKKGRSHVIIFFENGEESFSRKNPLHRKIMENGFYYFSEQRRTDKGEPVCFLQRFKFKQKNCALDDVGESHSRLFYVFALDDSGDYEGVNADAVFDDMCAALRTYVYEKDGKTKVGLPTVLNYYILTSGEVNYESYERRSNEIISAHLSGLPDDFERDGVIKRDPAELKAYIEAQIQINVISEATLCSHSLVLARKAHLNALGDRAFELDSAPDKDGAYRVAVIGFGLTGQRAMGELYTHTARLVERDDGYVPTQFIADIFDTKIQDKSGMFAYNHPLFRCLDEKDQAISDTKAVIERAKAIDGKAIEILCNEYKEMSGKSDRAAKEFIESRMAFPIAVMHKGDCFGYPFLGKEGTETAVTAAAVRGIRDYIVALGNDEKNIDMANTIIDSFRRTLLEQELSGKKPNLPHIKIYVNVIDERNITLLNWRRGVDERLFTRPYTTDNYGNVCGGPVLSVIPFGFREEMYSYSTFIEDYRERLYNYGYNLLSGLISAKTEEDRLKREGEYKEFKDNLAKDYNAYRSSEKVIDDWKKIPQFLRLSNTSALDFAVNYYKYKQAHFGEPSEDEMKYLARLEHERWVRFFISHGWGYATYNKNEDFSEMSKQEEKAKRAKNKARYRGVRQHNCLCPFDEMLDRDTKKYDRGNVELGFIKGIVFGKSVDVSVMGDSISTYDGFNPYGFPVYYYGKRLIDNEMDSVDDTWWKQVIDGVDGELLVNNSYSGSTVAGEDDSCASSAARCNGLGDSPDIILIYMGANDRGVKIEIGTDEPNNGKKFFGAYRKMLRQLKQNYPSAKIVCATLLNGRKKFLKENEPLFLPSEEGYNDAIRLAAKRENCVLADLAKFGKRYETLDYVHPTQDGHRLMAQLFLQSLLPKI